MVSKCGDLGQVRDHQHLMALPEGLEPDAHLCRRLATDAGVDLVKHKRGKSIGVGAHRLDREHQPGELAT